MRLVHHQHHPTAAAVLLLQVAVEHFQQLHLAGVEGFDTEFREQRLQKLDLGELSLVDLRHHDVLVELL